MKTAIFIVTVGKHFAYLKYALRSITRFASGFEPVIIMVPSRDYADLPAKEITGPMVVKQFNEWPDKGMLHHELLEICADQHTDADFILHFDSDMVFTEAVTPEDFVKDGKPEMVYGTYEWLKTVQENLLNWKKASEAALGFSCDVETMRRPGICHVREVYPLTRRLIHDHVKAPIDHYIRAQRNEFPQTFAEYPTLGSVAWVFLRDKYKWVNQQTDPFPPSKIRQAWSHRQVTTEDLAAFGKIGLL